MSDQLSAQLTDAVRDLEGMGDDLADQFLDGLKNVISDASEQSRVKLQALLRDGARFKWKALTADTPELTQQYSEAVDTTVRRIKTILLAERIVAEEAVASLISTLFTKALDGLGTISKGVLQAVAAGIVQGAIKGIMGSEGGSAFDPSNIFPNL